MEQMRVLLVDDEEELVSTLQERLTLRGISAEGVTTGSDALERVRNNPYDVVVLDVKMPGMDGLKVLKKMKKMRPEMQILLLTGRGSEKESAVGLDEGAYDYLVKPINIEDLIQKMKEAVNDSQQDEKAKEPS